MDDAARHLRVKALFLVACDLPDAAAQRAALHAQGADAATVTEVMTLLGHADGPTHFSTPLAQAAQALDDELQEGDVLGAWTLQGTLGQGGMGRVFGAERSDGHYTQRAALKLLRGWSGPDAAARFARERQILANLDHPHIARLLDGGTTPRGRPYLVMELVDGQSIDAHSQTQALTLQARLALFDTVCAAVEHAHRHLVIHCDIKPDNVRVSADGQAKLLDFGIAQLQGQADELGAAFTPGYASPEQMAGQPPGMASDVFGLGCLLRTLLQPVLRRQRRHDELRAVLARATAEAPGQRYASVDALRRDLRDWSSHRPVAAMPATLAYRTARLLRRRWAWATVLTAAVGLTATFTWQLARERDIALAERQRAESEVQTTRETARLLMSLFTGADPQKMGLPEIPKSIPLAAGRERLQQQMAADPNTRARLQMILGDVYERIGQMPEAAEAFRLVADLYGPTQLNKPLAEAEAQRRLALALNNSLRQSEAEAPARRGLALLLQHDSGNLPEIAEAQNRLGIALLNMRQLEEARVLLESSVQLRIRTSGAQASQTLSTRHNLSRVNRMQGRWDEAERQIKLRLSASRAPLDDGALGSLEEYGTLLSDMQRHTEAEVRAREAVAGWAARYGSDNANVGIGRHKLAYVLLGAGRLDEAQTELQAALRIETRSRDLYTVRARNLQADLARVHMAAGRLHEAEQGWAVALAPQLRSLPPITLAAWQRDSAQTLAWLNRPAEAQVLLAQALAVQQQLPAHEAERLRSELLQVEIELARGQVARAATLLDRIDTHLPPATFPALHQAAWALRGRLALHASNPAEAEKWLGRAWREALAWRGGPHPSLMPIGIDLMAALRAGHRPAQEALLLPDLQRSLRGQDETSPWRARLQALTAAP
jgi:eukaryotic-like serine/threonine-protein kinase